MKEKLKQFFEIELYYTKEGLDKERDFIQRNNICWYAMQRGLGASTFAEMCGLSYEDVEKMFEDYKNKLEEMQYAVR